MGSLTTPFAAVIENPYELGGASLAITRLEPNQNRAPGSWCSSWQSSLHGIIAKARFLLPYALSKLQGCFIINSLGDMLKPHFAYPRLAFILTSPSSPARPAASRWRTFSRAF